MKIINKSSSFNLYRFISSMKKLKPSLKKIPSFHNSIIPCLYNFWILIILMGLAANIQAAGYYLDADKGNDSFNGNSPEKAWKSISKVNDTRFKPGDRILFKCGETWTDMLVPSSSGNSSASITYGSYGTGDKPVITLRQIIPNSDKNNKWEKTGNNIYSLHLDVGGTAVKRIWLDNEEYEHSDDPQDINDKNRWFYDDEGKIFYLYSTSNPAESYKSIEFPGGINNKYQAVKIVDKNYLVFSNLDLQGGYTATIGLGGCSHIIIEDCNIGKYAHSRAIVGNQNSINANGSTTDYITIRNNIFDSGWRIFAGYDRSGMDGISIQNGASYWEIYNNKFIDWGHSAIQIYGIKAPTLYNKVYQNFFTAPDISYSRAFETVGSDTSMCCYNEFFRNRVSYTTVRNQIGGTHNKVYYNIFDHMKNSIVQHGGHTTAQAIVFAKVAGPSEYNIACNNTIYATGRDGIWDYGDNNTAVNNLIIDAGRDNKGFSLRVSKHVEGSTWQKNLIYVPGRSDNDYLVNYQEKIYTIHEFNMLDRNDDNKISGNILYTGKLNELVVDAENGNFAPVKNSPLIDAGIDMGLKVDFYGHPIINKPDIGAVEYSNESLGKNESNR